MRLYNRYLTALAMLFSATTVVLAVYNQQRLDLYFSVYLIEYLVATLLFASLSPKAHRLLNIMGFVLFAGFLFIVVIKVLEILLGAVAL